MRILATGLVHDGQTAPPHQRSCAFTTVCLLEDGTILVSGRWGSARDSADGHACVFATPDRGEMWEKRYDSHGLNDWNGTTGEDKGLTGVELEPGHLHATSLWVDRSDPSLPFINPDTQGLLPMRIMHRSSTDGGRSWGPPRRMDTTPHLAASPCSSALLQLPDDVLAQPYEQWKEYDDASPGRPAARLRFSIDGGKSWPEFATVAQHPDNILAYWDQRLAIHPNSGRLIATFWTHNFETGEDLDIHIAWGSPDGRTWTVPQPTGLPGQHCQPLSLGGDRLLGAYTHRKDPPGIVLSVSEDFGETWDRSSDLVVYDSTLGTESGAAGSRSQADYWNDMERWRFGHPRAILLDNSEVFVVYYAGDDDVKSARWARVAL
ncbi:MAG: hypothetical protein CME26_14945 [Gemmatimonadetes bacterium]|nr:hypothetical protein [Gemmatimonadota bacterium]|tara:strand:- start:20451 stop:21581 length:1131 start_codon:yes stop_codon:yes gene_type:complete